MRPLILSCLMLVTIGCASSDKPTAEMPGPGPAPVADVLGRPTTEGELALGNLDAQIKAALDLLEETPDSLGLASQAVGLLLTRIQYAGNYDDFAPIDRLTARMTVAHGEEAEAWLLRADFLSAVHRFVDAHAALARAEQLGAPPQDERRATYWLATGENLEQVRSMRESALAKAETYKTLISVAAVYAAQGAFAKADTHYMRALTVYRDVSPLPVAWISFQRGVMWSEMAGAPAWGKVMYQEAVRRLPNYTVANVHLAELEHSGGEEQRAIERLARVAELAFDPEPESRLAGWLERTDPGHAAEFLRKAESGYDSLLRDYEAAFRDHAAEFFLGAGKQPARALRLALANLQERKVPRAYLIALAAARAAGDRSALCSLYERARAIHTNANLEELVAEVAADCR